MLVNIYSEDTRRRLAGRGLVFTLAMQCLKKREFQFGYLVANYPPSDNYEDPADKPGMENNPAFMEKCRQFMELYFQDWEAEGRQPLASPRYADDTWLRGFPEIMINTAKNDPLHTEAEEFGLRLARLGTQVHLRQYQNSGHGFVIYATGDEWQEAEREIAKALRGFFNEEK